MSLNKIIIGFIIILLLFSGFILLQINASAPKSKVTIDKHTFMVETATTPQQQQQGLSGRKSLAQDRGMLFIFKTSDRYPFWMKDMNFPLDMIFINNNKIVDIIQDIPAPKKGQTNLPIYTPSAAANQVLEINSGLAKTYKFKKGDTVTENLK